MLKLPDFTIEGRIKIGKSVEKLAANENLIVLATRNSLLAYESKERP